MFLSPYYWQIKVEEARREEERCVDALLEEAELEVPRLEEAEHKVLRLEALRLFKKLQQIKEVQREHFLQGEDLAAWPLWPELYLQGNWLDKLLQLLELILAELIFVESILAKLRRRNELIHCFLSFLAMLWQKLLESLLFCHNLLEAPNKYRPPCTTTMPWNIPPALVVLWGVCWMFNPWSPINDIQLQPLSAGEQPLFSPDTDNELTGQYQLQNSVTSNEPDWGLPGWDFPGLDLEDWHFSGHPEYGNLQRIHPESFAHLTAPNTQLVSTAEVAPLQTLLAASDPFSFPGQHVNASELAGYFLEPGLIHFPGAPSGSTADQQAISLPSTIIEALEGADLTLPIERQTASIAEGDQRKGHAQLPTPSARFRPARQIEHTADPPNRSTTYKRSEVPPRNAEGKMTCKHIECSNLAFTRICDWNKHMDKHERPYICTVDGCDHLQGFTSKGDLSRHQRIVHKPDSGQGSLLFCNEPNCARGPSGGPNAGFSRSDNLADHIRRKHGQSPATSSCIPKRVEIANDTILSGVRSESPRRVDKGPVTSLQRKRRRISEMGLSSQNTDQGDEEEIYLRSELRKATQREEELTKELKELKEVHKKCEEKTEVLVGIIERLTQQPK